MKCDKHTLYEIPREQPGKPCVPQGFFFDGIEQLIVHTAWREPVSKLKRQAPPDDPCCKKNPQAPTVAITSVKLSADFSELEVSVSASHPCGIDTIEVYIAKVTYEQSPLPPFEVIRFITPLFVDGQMIDTSSSNPWEGGGEVRTTLTLKADKLVGKIFNVAVVAVNRCKKSKGAVTGQLGIV